MAKAMNGRTTINWILGSLLIAVLLAAGGISFSRAEKVGEKLERHDGLAGHPVIVSRVDNLQITVNEIRSDVKTLLRRNQ